jgi:hypothetical protein
LKAYPSLPLAETALAQRASIFHQSLPEEYAIALTPDGLFYPLLVSYASPAIAPTADTAKRPRSIAMLFSLRWEWEDIPPASGAYPGEGLVAYASWEEAIAWCYRRIENISLLTDWDTLATHLELFPERNVFYDEHIRALLSQAAMDMLPPGISICPLHRSVCAWITCLHHGKEQRVFAEAETIDAVWEALYNQVYQWVCQLHGIPRVSAEGSFFAERRCV